MSNRRTILVVVACCVALSAWSFAWNRGFLTAEAETAGKPLNDITAIYQGYHETPNLLTDGLRWWHGPWIQVDVASWRPISSYVYWIDCYAGEHYGRTAWGWIGLALLIVEAAAAAWLAWRLTRWWPGAALAALLLPLQCHISVCHPKLWLFWFPVHQEIVTGTAFLVVLALFDIWLELGGGRRLALFGVAFLLACATKETCFILPALLAPMAAWRYRGNAVSAKARWLVVGATCAAVLGCWFWRAAVIPHPRNPSILLVQIPRKMGLNVLSPITLFGLGGEWGVALVPITCTALYYWHKHRRPRWYLFWPLAYLLVMVPVYLWPGKHLGDLLIPLIDKGPLRMQFLRIELIVWTLMLYRKYAASEPGAVLLAMIVAIYIPNIDFGGWHYEVVPWAIRVVNWALVAKVFYRYLVVEGNGTRPLMRLGEAAHRLTQRGQPSPA